MKKNKEDVELREFLKTELPRPGENPWFTRKVINRLPEHKRNYVWIEHLVYLVCGIICGIYWKELISSFNFTVITVGELLKYGALVCATFGLVFATLYRTVLKD